MVFLLAMSRELCSPIRALSCHIPGEAHPSVQRLVLARAGNCAPLLWHRRMRHPPRWETPLAEFYRATDPRDVQTTRATAQLPGLDLTILHRQSPQEGIEEISIHLRALPTFAALRRSMEI